MNFRIRVPEVRVIDAEGKQLGVMHTRDALAMARDLGLDLVEVAPMAQPPVCRIIDYGKHKYDEAKKQRQARKNAHQTEIKGVRLKPATEAHDLDYKLKDTIRFLQEGHKVQVTLIFRGREAAHPEIGRAQMDRLAQGAAEAGVVERPPVMEGRRMTMLLAPK
jgi:translation initiation factor IF-3